MHGADIADGAPIRSRASCYLEQDGAQLPATVVDSALVRSHPTPVYQYYVHLEGTDKRLDRWVEEKQIHSREKHDGANVHRPASSDETPAMGNETAGPSSETAPDAAPSATALGKRKRFADGGLVNGSRDVSPMPNSREQAPQAHAVRNIDRVSFGAYDIRTWYYSPYPLEDVEHDLPGTVNGPTASSSADARLNGSAAGPSRMARNLWVCEGCFKYMKTFGGWKAHSKVCPNSHPPGKKVYQRGAHTIWEVQGEQQKLYGQNLSLFGKLFIDHKTIYFDVEPFNFYVLTDATTSFDHPIGFFSRERVSYDDYNLACIVTFPPFQKKSYGTLMIEFSYYLSALNKFQGTPERPLSDLGLKGYLSFWASVVLRTLALSFNMQDLPVSLVADSCTTSQLRQNRFEQEVMRIRRLLAGFTAPSIPQMFAVEGKKREEMTEEELIEYRKRLRLSRGWAGEDAVKSRIKQREQENAQQSTSATALLAPDDSGTSMQIDPADTSKLDESAAVPDITASVVTMNTTLHRLAHACNLRVDDVAFALAECGLLTRRVSVDGLEEQTSGGMEVSDSTSDSRILLSQDSVRTAILSRKVKRPLLDLSYVLA